MEEREINMITYGSTTLTSYNTITKIEVYYYQSTSPTTQTGGSWSTTKPTWVDGRYVWQKIRTTYEGKLDNGSYYSESDPVNITGQQGATGTSAYSYKLNASDTIVSVSKNGIYSTNNITFSATFKQGAGAISAYAGRFKIETTADGTTWKTEYTSSGNEASKEFTIPDDIIAIKCSLYQSDGTTVLLDIVTVPVVKDGVDAIGLRDSIPYYLASDKDTGITKLTQGWTRYRPQLTAEKKYLWVYYVSRYSEGTTEPELIEIKDDLVHFVNNGDESPVESCVVDIEPVQDLHGYDSPWPAGGGKNILPPRGDFEGSGIKIVWDDDGKVTFSGTAEDNITVTIPFTLSAGTTITFSLHNPSAIGSGIRFMLIGGDEKQIYLSSANTSITWTPTADVTSARFRISNGATINGYGYPQIELGSTATSYAPYSNECPITGWTRCEVVRSGINIWNEEWELGGIVVATGLDYYTSSRIRSKGYCVCKPSTNYHVNQDIQVFFYDVAKTYIKYATGSPAGSMITTPSNACYFRIVRTNASEYANNISVNYPASDHDYHPYSGRTYPITFPTEAGTVYGGTLDVTKGELVVDRICHTYEGGTDDVINARSIDPNNNCLSIRTNAFPHVVTSNGRDGTATVKPMCNTLPIINFDELRANTGNAFTSQGNWSPALSIQINGLNTVAEYDAWCAENKPQISWLLATPITYTLTPQEITMLCKENNIFADTGQTAISYYDNQTSTDPYVDYSATSAFEYANTAINRATATYGTCSTAANTAAKVVACPDFVLFDGARIQVTFTNANTASAPTLNVNSTGAKPVYINKTVTSDTNLLLWTAGSKMEFVYDGTGWIAQNVPYALYGTCSTGASTAAKTATCNEAVICKGTTISINMTNTNTAANATLNVGSTVAKDIYANGTKLTVNSRFNWRANTVQKFVFDGQVWRMDDDSVKALATAYITEIDEDGIMVHPEDDSNSGWAISDAIQLFKNGISYIKLWIENNIPKIRIGKEDQGHIILDNDSVDVRNGDDILASFGETSIIGDQNQWHQTIASDKTSFANGQTEYAYISPDKFYAVNAEVSDAFYIGNYSIRNAKDGKLIIGLRRR